MYLALVVGLLGFQGCPLDARAGPGLLPGHDAGKNTSYKIIDTLKANLQKNNDDYKDITITTTSGTITIPSPPETADTTLGHHRRAYDQDHDYSIETKKADHSKTDHYPKDTTRYPKYVNKEKADKIVKFLDKYKGLVTKFMEGKRGAGSVQWRAREPARGTLRLPSALQLDMAPALGGKIHSLRMQNQLCERYVMMPEGPKYDSKGRVYLHEYTPLHGKDFPQTRAPVVVLPKCCNCCAKSVLGCE